MRQSLMREFIDSCEIPTHPAKDQLPLLALPLHSFLFVRTRVNQTTVATEEGGILKPWFTRHYFRCLSSRTGEGTRENRS